MDATPFPRYDVALTPMRFTADVTSYPVFAKIIPSNESAPRVWCVSMDDVICPVALESTRGPSMIQFLFKLWMSSILKRRQRPYVAPRFLSPLPWVQAGSLTHHL